MSWRARIAALLLPLSLACSSEDGAPGSSKPVRAFQHDDLPSGTVVYLRQKELSGSKLVLELATRNVSDAYGVAWRMSYDPAVLSAHELEPTSVFAASHVHALEQPRPGLSVAVVSARGASDGIDAPDTALATLELDVLSGAETRIDFVAERSGVVLAGGTRAPSVQWVGGKLSAD